MVLKQKKMPNFTASSKIRNCIENILEEHYQDWEEYLVEGDLLSFEKSLFIELLNVYDSIAIHFMEAVSQQICESLSEKAKRSGAKKIAKRPMSIRLSTGTTISVESPYVKDFRGEEWSSDRNLLRAHWKIIGQASPALYDKVGYCAALGPSYQVAHETLSKFGTNLSLSATRDISNALAAYCHQYGEEDLVLGKKETLENKRVVIALDGGRTRTREYTGVVNTEGNATYNTHWREPKLFVIDVLDDEGNVDQHQLPIYGCRFAEDDIIQLLGDFLKKLEIDKAAEVQILGDGAPWLWNRLPALLEQLNVAQRKITQTLDYYHASSYIHHLIDHLPKRIDKQQRSHYLAAFKHWLWDGQAHKIIQTCQQLFQRMSKEVKRWLNYLKKHEHRMQYAYYKQQHLMCASGIVESAIRRIINLRFKNASTFWKKENVEKLFFLRAAVLSRRWSRLMCNLAIPN